MITAYFDPMKTNAPTAVLYNANCPVCNFEISHYARYSERENLPIRFDDLNSDARQDWGIDADMAARRLADMAARRLYVLHEGTLTSGIPAFLVLWAQMPKYATLGRIVGLPGVKQIASLLYDHVLAPVIYRWHLLRVKKAERAAVNAK